MKFTLIAQHNVTEPASIDAGEITDKDYINQLVTLALARLANVTLSQRGGLKTEGRSGAAMARLNQRSRVTSLAPRIRFCQDGATAPNLSASRHPLVNVGISHNLLRDLQRNLSRIARGDRWVGA
jgi:hypothetical protein